MYGDEAWDRGIDGGPPLKMLLSLEKEEIEYVKQGVLTARREEAKRLHSSRRDRNVSPRDANEESSHVYGINDVTLNMKYENEITTITLGIRMLSLTLETSQACGTITERADQDTEVRKKEE